MKSSSPDGFPRIRVMEMPRDAQRGRAFFQKLAQNTQK